MRGDRLTDDYIVIFNCAASEGNLAHMAKFEFDVFSLARMAHKTTMKCRIYPRFMLIHSRNTTPTHLAIL